MLRMLAGAGNVDTVRSLSSLIALLNINYVDWRGCSVLHQVARSGNRHEGKGNCIAHYLSVTFSLCFSRHGHLETVIDLVSSGNHDPMAGNNAGWTPLHIACL